MKQEDQRNIITDPTALAELRECKTVKELKFRLNQMDIECTQDEALRFLRTWEKLDEEREVLDMGELNDVSGGSTGIVGTLKFLWRKNTKSASEGAGEPLTIADILQYMK